VSAVTGAGYGGLPTFANREISTVIRLKDGETNLLAGLIRDDERRVLRGVVGLSDLPIIGALFAQSQREAHETDIVLTLTPRIIRVLELNEADLRPYRVGRDAGAAPVALPVPLPLQPAPTEPAAPDQPAPPPAQPRPETATPILPPAPPPGK
jgi:general secretion pathway protein D